MLKMIFRTNSGRIAAKMRKRARIVTPALIEAQKKLGEDGVQLLRKYSSATSYKITGEPPYPYSTALPNPPLPPYYINMQTGDLMRGWRYRTTINSQGIGTTWYNMMLYIRYFSGTKLMISRPIFEKVLKDLRPKVPLTYHDSYWNKWPKDEEG